MKHDSRSAFTPKYYESHPIFFPIYDIAKQLHIQCGNHWPDISDYQSLLEFFQPGLKSDSGAPIQFVLQGEKATTFDDYYEPRIYLKGEVQTRLQSWHDLFQVLVWCRFPKLKKIINRLHFESAKERRIGTNRTSKENALALFDECGAILISKDTALSELIRERNWKSFFWENRNRLRNHFYCVTFGHAMYEKALKPYLGMTSHCILIDENNWFPEQMVNRKIGEWDDHIARMFAEGEIASPKDFSPFPLLGLPDWYRNNQRESFFHNTEYFRPKRTK